MKKACDNEPVCRASFPKAISTSFILSPHSDSKFIYTSILSTIGGNKMVTKTPPLQRNGIKIFKARI